MKSLKRFFYINKGLVLLNLIVILALGILGFFLHDVILALDSGSDEEMTVFPLGTLFMYIGLFVFICFFSYQKGMTVFSTCVAMGQTRRSFYIEQFLLRLAIILVDQLFIYGMYRLELLKFERFYYPEYSLELSMDFIFTWKITLIVTLGLLSFCMLVLALALKFGMKANIIVTVVYVIFIMSLSKIEVIADYVKVHVDLASCGNWLYAAAAVMFVVAMAVSVAMVGKQSV